jgi:hypothetical protein
MMINYRKSSGLFLSKTGLIVCLALITVGCGSCRQVRKSWEVSRRAVDEFQEGKAEALCSRFSDEMLEAMPCDSTDLIIRQTAGLHGKSMGKCKWHYTYRVTRMDPFRSVARYKCPYTKEPIILTVVVDVTDNGAFVTGLWSNSELIRNELRLLTRVALCEEVNENTNRCDRRIEKAQWSWPRVYVWTSWQGVKNGDKLIMEWFSPAGQSVTDFVHEAQNGSSKTYNFWSYIEPEEVEVENPYGTWTVKIGANGKLIEEYPLEIIKRE